MRNVIVTFAKGAARYLQAVERIKSAQRGNCDLRVYYDESELGCPPHKENPYAFKAYAVKKAYEDGYDNILWLDSVVTIEQPLDKLFKYIQEHGTVFFDNVGYKVHDFCNQSCIDIMGVTRTEHDAPMIMACVMGLNRDKAKEFISQYYDYCQLGAFKGEWSDHRHDQTVASILIERHGYPILNGWETFFMYDQHIGLTIEVDGKAIKMDKGKDVCLVSK